MAREPRDFSKTPLYAASRSILPSTPFDLPMPPIPRSVPRFTQEEGLVKYLRGLYPARCRGPMETEREHERYAGKVDLIDEIEAWLEEAKRLSEAAQSNTRDED